MTRVITARAPGKLFVAGEYAVVTPGEPSVLVAVDRFLSVRLTPTDDVGSVHSPEYGQVPLQWRRDEAGVVTVPDRHPYDYALSAIRVAEQLRSELGLEPRFFDLLIESGLDDASGRKFGLGSSAAVVVATLRAIDEFSGFGLTRLQLFQLALLATIEVNPSASGGDVAASTYGGWISYSSPDRDALRAFTAEHGIAALLRPERRDEFWPHLQITRLSPPDDLRFLVGWTGEPASTSQLVGDVGRRTRAGAGDHPAFLLDSRACVSDLCRALDAGDDAATLAAIRRARRLLQRLGADTGIRIETPRLTTLCDSAESVGAAGKSSGAGGGDCGIVLAPPSSDLAALLRTWEAHDIRHLTIAVQPPEGAPDGA